MDHATLNAVCTLFDLGSPRGEAVSVAGGLTNRLWRVATSKGEFAVKHMNRDLPLGFAPSSPDRQREEYVAWFDRAFTLELAAHAAGVPMPAPVATREGRCLAEIGGAPPVTVRVHAWVDGAPLANNAAYVAADIAAVATMMARIHGLAMPGGVRAAEALRVFGDDHWRGLVERLRAEAPEGADMLDSLRPVLLNLEHYVALAHADPTPLLLGHRDSDMKNVLRRADGTLVLVDWDAAGPVNPRQDVANHALVWAGVHMGDPRPKDARMFVAAYMDAAGASWSFQPHDLAELVAVRLGWFEFNVHRALGERVRDDADRQFGLGVLRRNVDQLPRFARSLGAWLAVLSDAL